MKTLTFIGANGFIGKSFVDYFDRGLFKKFGVEKLYLISRNIKNLKKIKNSKKIILIKADISKLKILPFSDYVIYAAEHAEIKKKDDFNKLISNAKNQLIIFVKL